jgi:hypothetical protein
MFFNILLKPESMKIMWHGTTIPAGRDLSLRASSSDWWLHNIMISTHNAMWIDLYLRHLSPLSPVNESLLCELLLAHYFRAPLLFLCSLPCLFREPSILSKHPMVHCWSDLPACLMKTWNKYTGLQRCPNVIKSTRPYFGMTQFWDTLLTLCYQYGP